MSENLSDINSMFKVPRDSLGELIMRHVRGRLDQGGDSDNLRPFRSIGDAAADVVAGYVVSKQRAAE